MTTALTEPAELRVMTGGDTKTYPVPIGMQHTDVPFAVGAVTVQLWRNGTELSTQNGHAVRGPGDYSYNVYTNYFIVGGSDGSSWLPTDKWKAGFIADWFTVR